MLNVGHPARSRTYPIDFKWSRAQVWMRMNTHEHTKYIPSDLFASQHFSNLFNNRFIRAILFCCFLFFYHINIFWDFYLCNLLINCLNCTKSHEISHIEGRERQKDSETYMSNLKNAEKSRWIQRNYIII